MVFQSFSWPVNRKLETLACYSSHKYSLCLPDEEEKPCYCLMQIFDFFQQNNKDWHKVVLQYNNLVREQQSFHKCHYVEWRNLWRSQPTRLPSYKTQSVPWEWNLNESRLTLLRYRSINVFSLFRSERIASV